MLRLPLAVVTVAAASALAAKILGEYDLRGVTPLVSGVMLALVIGELAVVVAGSRSVVLGIACALTVGASLLWALWISSGNDWSFVSASGWVGVGLGLVTGLVWAGPRRQLRDSGPPEGDTRPAP
ncbi:MAG: hypothetical protein ABIS21_06440 [Acidimicrobiales bacterium]